MRLVERCHPFGDDFTLGRHNIEGSSLSDHHAVVERCHPLRLQLGDDFTLGRHNIEGSSLIVRLQLEDGFKLIIA